MTPLKTAARQALETLESGALLCEVTAASMLRVALEAEQAQTANSRIASLYEELRKAIDEGSESMTHDDALKQIAYWQNKEQQVAVPVAWMKFARKKPAVTSLSFSSELSTLEKAHGFVSTPLCHCAPPAEAQQVEVPAGWALVPIEPTPEMIAAGRDLDVHDTAYEGYRGVYKAMLAAAQGAKP